VQHERGGRGVAAEHLHDGHARRAGRHVHEALELPHAGRVVVSLKLVPMYLLSVSILTTSTFYARLHYW
jgi:hypothetical protein